jgi:hypothetical protein
MHQRGTVTTGRTSNTGVDDDERQALKAEGLDPDDPIDVVRWALSLIGVDHVGELFGTSSGSGAV